MDLISRQAAIDELEWGAWGKEYDKVLAKAMLESLPSVQQEQRWIPVSEMLPETDGYYLVTKKTFGWNGEQYEDIDIAWYGRKNGWLKADNCIAWIPLPEPYEGGAGMNDLISRQAAIKAIEDTDWYHINRCGELVQGANSEEDIPLFKADDVYKALRSVPSEQRGKS